MTADGLDAALTKECKHVQKRRSDAHRREDAGHQQGVLPVHLRQGAGNVNDSVASSALVIEQHDACGPYFSYLICCSFNDTFSNLEYTDSVVSAMVINDKWIGWDEEAAVA